MLIPATPRRRNSRRSIRERIMTASSIKLVFRGARDQVDQPREAHSGLGPGVELLELLPPLRREGNLEESTGDPVHHLLAGQHARVFPQHFTRPAGGLPAGNPPARLTAR